MSIVALKNTGWGPSMNIFDENTHLGGPQKKKTWSL